MGEFYLTGGTRELEEKVESLEGKVESLERTLRKRNRCFALRIKDIDDRVVFIGRFMCVSLFLSVVAVVMAALF